ncbi:MULTISPECIES: PilW family protein [Acinetobacter]|uniref:PilW family protein n=1 Tax=Acinetobacter TaxID=469 RepID=UPI000CEC861A|nr:MULTISPECIES: PilW family protein [Acinetobacter]MCO8098613.1 PilW family protein [Acinetobacter indicus]MCO8104216.1 PilW family protein [Acinetobacter indicus]MCO8109891.1 PilW family protein [Acinetobacter indicus]MDM1291523.1 PilW family protein [Acinetobacter indicus]MDM1321494.1 PilW family protein [Acinetobacter indicus]
MNIQRGFTLIELMIALILGSLIVAASIQVFINANQSLAFQQSSANIQNSGLFGIDYIVRDLRRANIDSNSAAMTIDTLHGGIVFNNKNISKATMTDAETINALLTKSSIGPSNFKNLKSDQIVIQYKNTIGSQFNCEGVKVLPNQFVVQRYFLKEEKAAATADQYRPLSLRCKATVYTGDSATSLDLSGDGEMLIPNVDHLRVLLGVARDNPVKDGVMDDFLYVSPSEYIKLIDKPQIVSIQLGILVRSPESVANGTELTKFTVLDLQNKELLTDPDKSKYLRQVITQTVALRNGFGVENRAE